jgi:hypothetical protein
MTVYFLIIGISTIGFLWCMVLCLCKIAGESDSWRDSVLRSEQSERVPLTRGGGEYEETTI